MGHGIDTQRLSYKYLKLKMGHDIDTQRLSWTNLTTKEILKKMEESYTN